MTSRPDTATQEFIDALAAETRNAPSSRRPSRATAIMFSELLVSAPFRARHHRVDEHDLVSELGMQAIRVVKLMHAGRIRRPDNLAAFAARVVRNTAIGLHRRNHVRRLAQQALSAEVDMSGGAQVDVDEVLFARDELARIVLALSADDRVVALLPALGFSDEEIGEVLDLKPNAVVQRRFRIRRRLQAKAA